MAAKVAMAQTAAAGSRRRVGRRPGDRWTAAMHPETHNRSLVYASSPLKARLDRLKQAQALQQDCGLGVCVCAAVPEQEKKAHRPKKKSASRTRKKPCPLISERLLAAGWMVEYYHRGIEPTLARSYYGGVRGRDVGVYQAAAAAVEEQAGKRRKLTPAGATVAVQQSCEEEKLVAQYSAL